MQLKNKFFCYYFPQFYPIPENDLHWGDGFTDWDNVKNAKPLFSGHRQPRVPLNGYYLQSDPAVVSHQCKVASSYGVDGFCFYHYWFDGKLVLEKPAEFFLNQKDINMQFCFSWANETWSKRWVGDDNTIIFKQTHKNDHDIWEKHFSYLFKFFSDERYLKIDGCPVFIIYNPHLIKNSDKMFDFWNSLIRDKGYPGIHFVHTKVSDVTNEESFSSYSSTLNFEPRFAYNSTANVNKSFFSGRMFQSFRYLPESILNHVTKIRYALTRYEKVDYSSMWDVILKNADSSSVFQGVFVGWDNTPRYKNRSKIYVNSTPDVFERKFKALIDYTVSPRKQTIFFINAWNEWSEGAYLEPDLDFGFKYLDVVKSLSVYANKV